MQNHEEETVVKKLIRLFLPLIFFLALVFLILWSFLSVLHAGSIDITNTLDIGTSFMNSINDSRSLHLNYESTFGNCELNSKFQYGKVNDAETQNNFYLRFGYDPPINEKWSLWIFDKAGYNRIRKIEFENFAGAGPKYTFYKTEERLISVSFGYLPHFQQFKDYSKTTNRLSLRLKGKEYIEKNYEIKVTLFYQPNMENFDDYLMNGEFSWKYRLAGSTSMKISVVDQYRSISEVKNELIGAMALVFEL